MRELEGALRSYAWGSRTAIAELRGLATPSNHPEAELWLGAHPGDPARVITESGSESLLEVLHREPERELGRENLEAFGERLPFLLKLLAAEEPLSLQAHPSAVQADEGFRRENALGVPMESPIRNYKDGSHKPELVVALSRFEALAGFREPTRTVKLLRALAVDELEPYIGLLEGQPDSDGLRALFTTWITLPSTVLGTLLPAVLAGCITYVAHHDAEFVTEIRTALELSEAYPGDAGVLAALLLNRVTLEPGQGLFLAAGNLHAYLHGLAVEIMANSDNVLRGGLTPKHVDVPELLRVLDFVGADIDVLDPAPSPGSGQSGSGQSGSGRYEYVTPAPEFRLTRLEFDSNATDLVVEAGGPRILICTDGAVTATCGADTLDLDRGRAAWIAADEPVVHLTTRTPTAQVFSAVVGR
ncbi:mannose-6-phosphate isomerase [Rhodococcus erythropolis CCM2595]|uniref:mannose-6-phosphate isomerase, class I n=1 Tax=Rhodococcus erythropolis TaxID=1833 RepID=UPI00038DCD31|nr:mannose-6-phosphate isomerase, class I [Rhodococcus erythropolis]AGT91930.1 mannose-6-phosphate isomerase [Rhodococcus erythropolis CCM2595]SUE07933.1 mannose-6-phosphate isomerase [Rhodococcus erythropolis]